MNDLILEARKELERFNSLLSEMSYDELCSGQHLFRLKKDIEGNGGYLLKGSLVKPIKVSLMPMVINFTAQNKEGVQGLVQWMRGTTFPHEIVSIREESKTELTEVHYKDLYGKGFEEFRKKYSKVPTYGMYVRFTSIPMDKLDRNPFQNPDHQDPIGVYAYPLSYVLKNPADIWYGMQAKFMGVLESKAKKILQLQELKESDAQQLLINMFGWKVSEVEAKWKLARKISLGNIDESTSKVAVTFMALFQWDISDPKEPKVRSGAEQTALLRKAGFDAVEDTAKTNKQAAINSREPEQIVFLHRGAFEIIETFSLGQSKSKEGVGISNDPQHLGRKLAAQIAEVMNDKLTSDEEERANRNGWGFFWTKGGKQIEIKFSRPESYYKDKKIGEKKHKESKLSSEYFTDINVRTPVGDFSYQIDSDEEFKKGLQRIKEKYLDLLENPKHGETHSKSALKEKDKKEQEAYFDSQRQKEKEQAIKDANVDVGDLNIVADKLGLPKIELKNDNDKERLSKIVKFAKRAIALNNGELTDEDIDAFKEVNGGFYSLTNKALDIIKTGISKAKTREGKNFQSPYWLRRDLED